jgi:hypothetical protein
MLGTEDFNRLSINDRRVVMRPLQHICLMFVGFLATLMLTVGGLAGVVQANRTTSGITADQVTACLKTAVAAQPGLVKEVEVEYKGTQWLCEVKLVDEAGKRHKLHVDVATNQVVKTK